MGFIEELNRFEELAAVLRLMASPGHIQTALRPIAERSGYIATQMIRDEAPVGTEEPGYTVTKRSGLTYSVNHGRPSVRMGLGVLSDQWAEPEIDYIEGGVSFTVMSTAPHIGILLEGSPPHDIPKKTPGPMSFWSFREGEPVVFGWNYPFIIGHPGFPPRDFVEKAERAGMEQSILSQLDPGLLNIVKPLTDFYNRV